jgi:hypothetical protein
MEGRKIQKGKCGTARMTPHRKSREKCAGISAMRKDVLAATIEIEDGEANHKSPRVP